MIDFSIIKTAWPYLLRGTAITLEIAFFASAIGLILGSFLAIMQTSKSKLLSIPVSIYVTIFRGTPMLIQIPFFVYYIFPALGFNGSLLLRAIVAIGLNSAAYISQIMRAGIGSVTSGQLDAAKALRLSPWQTMRYVVLPQAIRTVIPAILNELIVLIKDSSLASTIGVTELFKEGSIIISRTYNAIPIYCAIAVVYLVLTSALAAIVNYLDKKWNYNATN